jgi:hypothetical protein
MLATDVQYVILKSSSIAKILRKIMVDVRHIVL